MTLEQLTQLQQEFNIKDISSIERRQQKIKEVLYRQHPYHDLSWYDFNSFKLLEHFYKRLNKK
jgi:hypothetical protein